MLKKDRQALEEFARRVRERFPHADVWAFGSRARGDAAPDSDLDVCVVVDQLNEATDREIMTLAWEVGFEADIVISTVTFSRKEFTTGPLAQSPIVKEVLRSGIAA